MHPSISTGQNPDWVAGLRRQAERDARSAVAHVPPGLPRPRGRRNPASPGRISQQLWTLLHAQLLLAGPAAGVRGAIAAEDDYQRFTRARSGGYQGRMP